MRWFLIPPLPEGIPKPQLDASMRERFATFDGALVDQRSQQTHGSTSNCIEIICLRLTSSVSCREKHLSSSKAAKLDCGQATWSSNAGPTTPGTQLVVQHYSWPF